MLEEEIRLSSMFPTQAVPADYMKHPGHIANMAPNAPYSTAANVPPNLAAPAMYAKSVAPALAYPKSHGCPSVYPACAAPVGVILVLFVLLVIICRVWPVAPAAKTCKK